MFITVVFIFFLDIWNTTWKSREHKRTKAKKDKMKSEDVKDSIWDWSSLVLQGKNVNGTVARKKYMIKNAVYYLLKIEEYLTCLCRLCEKWIDKEQL